MTNITDDDITDLKGKVPESWLCIDCGVNTAPGCMNRKQLEQAFATLPLQRDGADGVEQSIDDRSEVYFVRERVWEDAGVEPMGGCLCIGCLERRLGRQLKPKDFPRHVFNRIPGTARLLQRRGAPRVDGEIVPKEEKR